MYTLSIASRTSARRDVGGKRVRPRTVPSSYTHNAAHVHRLIWGPVLENSTTVVWCGRCYRRSPKTDHAGTDLPYHL